MDQKDISPAPGGMQYSHPNTLNHQQIPLANLLQRHIANMEALVLDVGRGRLRLHSVQAADEAMSIGFRLTKILRHSAKIQRGAAS